MNKEDQISLDDAVRMERERCAKIAEDIGCDQADGLDWVAKKIAEEIRKGT